MSLPCCLFGIILLRGSYLVDFMVSILKLYGSSLRSTTVASYVGFTMEEIHSYLLATTNTRFFYLWSH
jgi:hypothetical protein